MWIENGGMKMAYIKVNCNSINAAAKAVDKYVGEMKKKMSAADNDVKTMGIDWQGSDYAAFQAKWGEAVNDSSVYMKMRKSLESYADYLRYAAKRYKDAQNAAVNRANSLPRF